MSIPGNGIYVVRGEMTTIMTAMRRGTRWNATAYVDEEKDSLLKLFIDLKQILNRKNDLRVIEPNVFLTPFLEIIRTADTTGPLTSLALASINKFLSYGLIDPTTPNLPVIVEMVADAVTHARFMGTDQSSDSVTFMRVIEVLHTLIRSPEGAAVSNESMCEVMLSCFKICFEPRLSELLRRSAEQSLKDMVLLFFVRLPQFTEEPSETGLQKRFNISNAAGASTSTSPAHKALQVSRNQSMEVSEIKKTQFVYSKPDEPQTPQCNLLRPTHRKVSILATTPATPAGNVLDMQGKITQTPTTFDGINDIVKSSETAMPAIFADKSETRDTIMSTEPDGSFYSGIDIPGTISSEYINSVGVRFTQQPLVEDPTALSASLTPYGLPFIQELFRFLIILCNPLDKQNSDNMLHTGLNLLIVAFEVGADNIGKYQALLQLVKDDLCRNLLSLLSSERLSIFSINLQLCFLIFESLRGYLKFQLEAYLKKLSEIITSDNPRTPYEMRELALENLFQLWRIPGFVPELYINYDCDLYCTDMFESLTNMLSKYTLSATNVVYSTHIISMDTLIGVIDIIERNCMAAKSNIDKVTETHALQTSSCRHSRHSSGLEGIIIEGGTAETPVFNEERQQFSIEKISNLISNSPRRLRLQLSSEQITSKQLIEVKQKKILLSQGTERFNQRPEKGIQYLQEHGILNNHLDPMQVALFLRENPGLDKKMIGEYISRKKNVDSKILINFVDSFDFTGLRIDEALRLYLETFRLPGEAPLIFLVLEHFSDHWHKQNNEPFANTDAAFRLAYAIIMLNMDQHNLNAKRLNVPMTLEDFTKNLRGLNGGNDFDQDLLALIFNAIKNEEIVMPAEQTGLVRENYLWKVLLRRGATNDGRFQYVHNAAYDIEIFNIVWGASLSALSFMFDKSTEMGYQSALSGFIKSAAISAHYNLHADFDALILTLCKFTTLLNTVEQHEPTPPNNGIVHAVNFGLNAKAQAAMRTVFVLVHEYGDCLRESWRHILDLFLQLFRLKLLPKSLIEVEDFCEVNGKALLILEKPREKQESGLFSSLYSYLSSEGQREPTYEEQDFIKHGRKCINECNLDQMLDESKFIQLESLEELLKCLLSLLRTPNAHKSIGVPYSEDVTVFWMEFLVKIVVHNRDRMILLWPAVRDHLYQLLLASASCGYDYLLNRCIVAVLKVAIYLMRNEELCPIVLQSLKMVLVLKPTVLLSISKQISVGIYELLKTSAQNIHSGQDWQIIFTILECVGAGAMPPTFEDTALPIPSAIHSGTKSDGALSSEDDGAVLERGYTSDSELSMKQQLHEKKAKNSSPTAENWILISRDSELASPSRPQSPPNSGTTTSSSLIFNCKLQEHSPFALFKCWDSLAFIVRSVAHITPYNFEACVRCIRIFVEASRDGGVRQRRKLETVYAAPTKRRTNKKVPPKRGERSATHKQGPGSPIAATSSCNLASLGSVDVSDIMPNEEDEDLAQRYEQLSIQLLDLMYTLYTRTAQIFRWWAEEGSTAQQAESLWSPGWCPLLQGIARLAMDRRREVRTHAISCLQQRALLVHDLQTLSGVEWSSCFEQVLFPLLNELLPERADVARLDTMLLEESRIRTATIMSKVFLQHLTTLIELGSAFDELWLEILSYIERFMKVGSDTLSEQMQEILKNMLLVMHSVRVFHNKDGTLQHALWDLTWRRIGEFLPNLKEELFHDEGKYMLTSTKQQHQKQQPEQQNTLPAIVSVVKSPMSSITLQPSQIETHQQHAKPTAKKEVIDGTITTNDGNLIINKTFLPDLVNEASAVSTPAILQETVITSNNAYNSSTFAFELPITTMQLNPTSMQRQVYQLQHQSIQSNDPVSVPINSQVPGNTYSLLPKSSHVGMSVAPVFKEPSFSSSEIYQECVQNPYNLKVPQSVPSQMGSQHQTNLVTVPCSDAAGLANTPVNYFNTNVDPSSIPPGSELLYGQH